MPRDISSAKSGSKIKLLGYGAVQQHARRARNVVQLPANERAIKRRDAIGHNKEPAVSVLSNKLDPAVLSSVKGLPGGNEYTQRFVVKL
ncbi:uncharacterized protein PHALS_03012 [Plasmopara halstedii]|uniref:Uncharacterized protein n=1 Tax=Plasmopara halstedii TaxID=4781 RepID=A0A0P1A831_PLAHL|nr:uncharacterized protein PHALS_03012 [Plasmopara halstedii]CEG36463.1 hypothetical protein PHALS_03012 [Plasmopara halstedii]|eukprot:XP_024572832.1 hypothetical protein PHALS_03012 [Plasmopara halstedii]